MINKFIRPGIFCCLCFYGNFGLFAQNSAAGTVVTFLPVYHGNEIRLNEPFSDKNGDSLNISILKFYLSNFVFYSNNEAVWTEKNSYHLLDLEKPSTFSPVFSVPENTPFNRITFLLGIDSATNVAGAFGGDLDPTNGMYWAWQSGYINAKIEGFSQKCPTRNGGFQFHLGGYAPPFQSAQIVEIKAQNQEMVSIALDLSVFFEQIDWQQKHSIMSPSKEAVFFSNTLANAFGAL